MSSFAARGDDPRRDETQYRLIELIGIVAGSRHGRSRAGYPRDLVRVAALGCKLRRVGVTK